MTARTSLQAAWDHTPLPLETLVGVAAAVLVQHLRPLRLPAWTRPAGLLLLGAGLTLITVAVRERGPGSLEKPPRLVNQGLHGYTRNPMYLGSGVVHLGLAGATRNAWILVSWPVSAALLHRAVLHEEGWLRVRFGDEYDAYRARVPRYA